jgi:hypothetical protein
MATLTVNGQVLVREQVKDVLRRLIPRLLVTVFLTILCVVYLSRIAVFCTLVSLAFQK